MTLILEQTCSSLILTSTKRCLVPHNSKRFHELKTTLLFLKFPPEIHYNMLNQIPKLMAFKTHTFKYKSPHFPFDESRFTRQWSDTTLSKPFWLILRNKYFPSTKNRNLSDLQQMELLQIFDHVNQALYKRWCLRLNSLIISSNNLMNHSHPSIVTPFILVL